jgi:hypothetical protein
MTTARRLLAALLFVIPAVTISAQNDGSTPDDGHWWCTSVEPQGPVYITGLWSGTYVMAEVANAFAQELIEKHAFNGRVNCHRANPGSTPAQIQSGPSSQISAWRGSGRTVSELPWIYDPAKARLPHLCTALVTIKPRVYTFYHNKILRIPGGTQAELTKAWAALMNERHPGAFIPNPGCTLISADTSQHQEMVDRHVQLYATSKPEVVQLEWVYGPAVPAGSTAGKPYVAPAAEKPAVPATPSNTETPPAVKPAGGSAGALPAASAPGPPSAQARDFATKEMPEVTAKCNSDRVLSGAFDCSMVARAVYNHRLANWGAGGTPVPLEQLWTTDKLDCSQCVKPFAAAWAASRAQSQGLQLAAAQCVGERFASAIKAKPYINRVQEVFDAALVECKK